MSALTSLGVEVGVAIAAGVLSFVAAPANGVQIHWNPEETNPWLAPALAYAFVVPVVVFVLGRIVVSVLNAGSGRAQRPLRVDCAAGVAFIVFAGFQRIPDFSVLLAMGVALMAGLAVYSGIGALRRSSGPDADVGAEPA